MRWLLLIAAAAIGACAAPARFDATTWRPGQLLAGHVRIPPGIYYLPDEEGEGALRLAPGTVLDLTGATLVGSPEGTPADEFRGTALRVRDAADVTIHGGSFRGYKVAVWASRADRLSVQHCDFSGNFRQRLKSVPERENEEDWLWPHHNDNHEWARNYGAGLYVEDSREVALYGNRARNGQNGIVLDRVSDARVERNDCSFLSGWGLALYRSSDNAVFENHFDFCVRGYSHGVYQRGQDSAGILVFEQCQRNRILHNTATYGGDGLFLYAGEESLNQTGRGGSNDNVVAGNDFSHAVANGIEATFSTGNSFAANRLHDCNYGVWAGYSSRSWFVDNDCARNRIAGIAIEHGRFNVIQGNRFEGEKPAVWLWWDPDEQLAETVWGEAHDLRSHGTWVQDNEFVECSEKVRLAESTLPEMGLRPWRYADFDLPEEGLHPAGAAPAERESSMQLIEVDEWGPRPVEPEYSRPAPARRR